MKNITPLPVQLENEDVEEVKDFTYLSSIMSKKMPRRLKDITNKLQKAKSLSWTRYGGRVTFDKKDKG